MLPHDNDSEVEISDLSKWVVTWKSTENLNDI